MWRLEYNFNMQTFLPYSNFQESAKVLDMKRLGKQRVETMQIMKALLAPDSKAWQNHPAVRMWKGYEFALLQYQRAIVREWTGRGYKDTCLQKTEELYAMYAKSAKKDMPVWLGHEKFHASHRSNLLRKKIEWYNQYKWLEPNDMEYVWPC